MNMNKLKAHQFCAVFLDLGKDVLKSLAADIKANGQHEKIKLFEGKILDGKNRAAACAIFCVGWRRGRLDAC